MRKLKQHYAESIIIDIWIVLFILALGLSALIFWFNAALSCERGAVSHEEQSISQGNQLKGYSDYLTEQARLFVITGEPEYMINYWTEVNLDKHRDKVIERLDELNMPINEKTLLLGAKQNSDTLIKTEAIAMKLVLVAMAVPSDRMPPFSREDTISSEDMALSPVEKISLAQRMLFNKEYTDNKEIIINHVDLFQAAMQQRLSNEIASSRQTVNRVFAGIIILTALIATLLTSIIWLKNALYLKNEDEKKQDNDFPKVP